MSIKSLKRTTQLGALLLVLSGCATASVHEVAWGPVDGAMCTVRVVSDYTTPVEAAARAGGREIELGLVEPESAHEFTVPCAHRAVTVYRVIPATIGDDAQLDSRARALDADDVTVVTLRPTTGRRSASLR